MPDEVVNTQLKALIDLLDEPDIKVYEKIRDQILSFGPEAIPILEDSWENTFDNLIQKRIEDLIHVIQFDNLQFEFSKWQAIESNNLLKGFLLITKFQYPEIDEEEIIKKIEQIRWDVWLELNESLTALEVVKVLNHVLFDIHKFAANKLNPNALQNHFINNLLDTQRGNSISLGILYLIMCQKLEIPIYGIDLPEHFVLAYTHEIKEGDVILRKDKSEVLFYINPSKKGAVFTKTEVDLYLTQIHVDPEPSYYIPCDNIDVIRRLINSLISSYQYFHLEEKVRELEVLSDILNS